MEVGESCVYPFAVPRRGVYDGVQRLPAGQGDVLAFPHMNGRERDLLEYAVQAIAEQARKADALVDEAKVPEEAIIRSRSIQDAALEFLKVNADLERELRTSYPTARPSRALGERPRVSPGHWARREPAPHGEPPV
jgi:hypothetical protein